MPAPYACFLPLRVRLTIAGEGRIARMPELPA